MWSDALAAKYDGVGTFGREQWDQLFGHCQAICDWPCVAFAKELIEAYPEAKVLVTTREVNSWHSSTMKTVHWRATEPELRLAAAMGDWAAGMYQPMLSSKSIYSKPYQTIQSLIITPQNSGPTSGKATSRRTASAATTNTTTRSARSCPRRTCSSTRWARAGSPCATSSKSPCPRASPSAHQRHRWIRRPLPPAQQDANAQLRCAVHRLRRLVRGGGAGRDLWYSPLLWEQEVDCGC